MLIGNINGRYIDNRVHLYAHTYLLLCYILIRSSNNLLKHSLQVPYSLLVIYREEKSNAG